MQPGASGMGRIGTETLSRQRVRWIGRQDSEITVEDESVWECTLVSGLGCEGRVLQSEVKFCDK
jgi:hypothetical protein